MAGLIGALGISGSTISQVCAMSDRVIANAAMEVELGTHSAILALLCGRTRNSPHVYYPSPTGIGGVGAEHSLGVAGCRAGLKAGERIRTADVQLGKLAFYH